MVRTRDLCTLKPPRRLLCHSDELQVITRLPTNMFFRMSSRDLLQPGVYLRRHHTVITENIHLYRTIRLTASANTDIITYSVLPGRYTNNAIFHTICFQYLSFYITSFSCGTQSCKKTFIIGDVFNVLIE